MQQKRDLAIVLRSIAYEERHRIVTALTEQQGVISAMARNAINSRRFGGALELFSASEWMYVEKPGADLHRLEQAQIRRSFEGLRKDFGRLSMASVFSELILRIAPKHEPCPELFRLHSNALACLEETPLIPPQAGGDIALLNGYLTKILQWSGSQPQIHMIAPARSAVGGFPRNRGMTGVKKTPIRQTRPTAPTTSSSGVGPLMIGYVSALCSVIPASRR